MVKKYLPLAEMLQLERRARARDRSEYEIFVLDTNAFKYNYSEVPDNVVVTEGVINELSRHPGSFKDESVKLLADLLNPEVVTPFVSDEDEATIYRASIRLPKDDRRKNSSGLGWVDTQQIAYAMDLARKGIEVALVSNDADFHNTIEVIGREISQVRERVFCLSARKYLEEAHKEHLRGLNVRFRKFILYELDKLYRVA